MVYTVTLNPSLDYILSVDGFQIGETNRTREEKILPGGKGLNVSAVLDHLGVENRAIVFAAGFSGQEIRRLVKEQGIRSDFIFLEQGYSRINVKLRDFESTEINGRGPAVPREKLEQLFEKLDRLREGDVLVLAGSVPDNLPETIYREILGRLRGRNILTAVDAAGGLLRHALSCRPFLIKPNLRELEGLFGITLRSRDEAVFRAGRLQDMGARNVLVSLGARGAVLLDENGKVHSLPAPEGKLVNAVGAGDSMTAGFLAGWLREKDYEYAFRLGIAAGSASAFSENLAGRQEIEQLLKGLI